MRTADDGETSKNMLDEYQVRIGAVLRFCRLLPVRVMLTRAAELLYCAPKLKAEPGCRIIIDNYSVAVLKHCWQRLPTFIGVAKKLVYAFVARGEGRCFVHVIVSRGFHPASACKCSLQSPPHRRRRALRLTGGGWGGGGSLCCCKCPSS